MAPSSRYDEIAGVRDQGVFKFGMSSEKSAQVGMSSEVIAVFDQARITAQVVDYFRMSGREFLERLIIGERQIARRRTA